MKKVNLLLIFTAFINQLVFSQVGQIGKNVQNIEGVAEKCGANKRHEHLMQTDPQYVQRRNQIELETESFTRNPLMVKTTYTIPVVVHVIHTGQAVGTGVNISDAQIQSAIANLNAAYSNTNTAFTTYTGSNTNIQFCLAQRDASGNPSTGIVRVNGSGVTQYSTKGVCDAGGGTGTDNEVAVKALSKWDNTKYYNIWVVSEINDNGGGSGTQGYAYFPGAGSSVDGSIMLYNSFGYDPDGSLGYNLKSYTNRNVTAVHEVGHALNLYHTFQGDGTGSSCPTDAVCGTSGDCVSDTPAHKRSTSDCTTGTNTCTGTSRELFIHNFMDYSSDVCQTQFTAGQVTRMQAVMAGSRSSLNASDGCNPVYTRDAGVNAIITPNVGTCGTTFTPEVTVKNFGSGTLTSFTVTCNIDGGTNETYNWTGSLTSGATVNITMPSMTTTAGSHTFNSSTSVPNGLADQYTTNDTKSYSFTVIGTPPTSASCSPTTTESGNYQTGINRVQFNTIDHAHADGNNDGLQDFSCQYNTTVSTNTAYTLTVTLDVSSEYCLAWIDYNDNGIFESSEKVLDNNGGGEAATSHSVSVTIPQYPEVTGKLIRMRIMTDYNPMTADGCTDTQYGEIEDYSIFITTPTCVPLTVTTQPTGGSMCEGGSIAFTGAATGTFPKTYQWQVDDGSGFVNVTNTGVYSNATTGTLNLTSATSAYYDYDYRLNITNGCGTVSSNSVTLYTLTSPTASCSPVTTNTGSFGTGIARMQFNTIDKSHNDGINDGTRNFTCSNSTTVSAGSTYAFTLTGVGGNPEFARIYIDYNDDGVYQVGEMVYNQNTSRATSHNGNITIPSSNVTTGKLIRMRVMTDYNPITGGCQAALTHGEVEDYGIFIPCIIPTISNPVSDSRCGTGTLDIGATPSAGTINWYDASSAGNLVGSGSTWTTPSISSTTTYYAEAVSVTCVSASRTAVAATVNNCSTNLNGASCNVTLTNLSDALYSTAVSGATNYRYLVEHASTGFSSTSTRNVADNLFRMSWVSGIKYGSTYTVKVASYVDGNWGAYSSACNVTTPATKMQTASCGLTVVNTSDALYSYEVAGATDYRYLVVNSAAGFSKVSTRGSANNLFRLSWVSGIQSATTYTVSVAAYVGGSWQAYGPTCTVTVPVPTTKLATASCNIAVPTLSTALYSDAVSGATNFRYLVTNTGAGFSKVSIRNAADNLFRLSWVSGIQLNTTYDVKVAAYVNGVWGNYGTLCTVTTPASISKKPHGEINNNELGFDFSFETYPNPNNGDFTISSSFEGTFNIVNELGQVIQKVEITKENNFETKVEGLDNGVYFVTGTINGEVITKRVMVLE
ncbi:MAG: GEVED domain-containing protein [Bacteroidota bacterium]